MASEEEYKVDKLKIEDEQLRNIIAEYNFQQADSNPMTYSLLKKLANYIKNVIRPEMMKSNWKPKNAKLLAGVVLACLQKVFCSPRVNNNLFSLDDFEIIIHFASNLNWYLNSNRYKGSDNDFTFSQVFDLFPIPYGKNSDIQQLSDQVYKKFVKVAFDYFILKIHSISELSNTLLITIFVRSAPEQRATLLIEALSVLNNGFCKTVSEHHPKIKPATSFIISSLQAVSQDFRFEQLCTTFLRGCFTKAFFSKGLKNPSFTKNFEDFITDIINVITEPIFPSVLAIVDKLVVSLLHEKCDDRSFIRFKVMTIGVLASKIRRLVGSALPEQTIKDLVADKSITFRSKSNFQNDATDLAFNAIQCYLSAQPASVAVETAVLFWKNSLTRNKDSSKGKVSSKGKSRVSKAEGKKKSGKSNNISYEEPVAYPTVHKLYLLYIHYQSQYLNLEKLTLFLRFNILDNNAYIRELALIHYCNLVIEDPESFSCVDIIQRTKDVVEKIRKLAFEFLLKFVVKYPTAEENKEILLSSISAVKDNCVKEVALKIIKTAFNLDVIIDEIDKIGVTIGLIMSEHSDVVENLEKVVKKLFVRIRQSDNDVKLISKLLDTLLSMTKGKQHKLCPYVSNLLDLINFTNDETLLWKGHLLLIGLVKLVNKEMAVLIEDCLSKVLKRIPYSYCDVLKENIKSIIKVTSVTNNFRLVTALSDNCMNTVKRLSGTSSEEGVTVLAKFSLIYSFIVLYDVQETNTVDSVRVFVNMLINKDSPKIRFVQEFIFNVIKNVCFRHVRLIIEEESIKSILKETLTDKNAPFRIIRKIGRLFIGLVYEEEKEYLIGDSEKELKEMGNKRDEEISEVIQEFSPYLLDLYMSTNTELRKLVTALVRGVNNFGILPIKILPTLIAMTSDPYELIRVNAVDTIKGINFEFIQMTTLQGIYKAYKLQQLLEIPPSRSCDAVLKSLYLSIGNSSHQKAFMNNMLSRFESTLDEFKDINVHIFLAENLAYFPYSLKEEVQNVVEKIEISVLLPVAALLAYFKNLLKIHGRPSAEEDVEMSSEMGDELFKDLSLDELVLRTLTYLLLLKLRGYLVKRYNVNKGNTYDRVVGKRARLSDTIKPRDDPEKLTFNIPDEFNNVTTKESFAVSAYPLLKTESDKYLSP